ncbi:MAG: tyrosine-type recombinase/integrase [Desulfitobacteriaceae bacterium]
MASIKKRGPYSYQITVSNGYDSDGEKILETKTIKFEPGLSQKQIDAELNKQAVLFEKEVKDGTYLDGGKMTFAEITQKWLDDYETKQLAPKTLARYKDMLDSRILPTIGHIKLQKLQPNHLSEFYNNLAEAGIRRDVKYTVKPEFLELIKERKLRNVDISRIAGIATETIRRIKTGTTSITAKTATTLSKALDVPIDSLFVKKEVGQLSKQSIKHHHRTISAILSYAVREQCIINNPASRIKVKVDKKEIAYFEEDMTEHMLSLLDSEHLKYKTLIYLAAYSGSRLGEVAGLEWSDVDFEHNLIRICRASQYLPGKGIITKDPKNESSKRIIAMPPLVMDLLKEYKARQNEERLACGDQWQDHDRLFTQWNGKPIFPTTPTVWFREFRRRHDLPDVKFHGLRHTNASLLIGQGVDVQTVAKRLGHTKATTTTSIYSHFLRRPDTEAADKLQNLFGKKQSDNTIPRQ